MEFRQPVVVVEDNEHKETRLYNVTEIGINDADGEVAISTSVASQ